MPNAPPTHTTAKPRASAAERGYKGKAWERTRRAVLLRDNYRCCSCGKMVCIRPRDHAVDHVVAKHQGGSDDESNLQTLCDVCHGKKTREGG